jgi:hypothetical protein
MIILYTLIQKIVFFLEIVHWMAQEEAYILMIILITLILSAASFLITAPDQGGQYIYLIILYTLIQKIVFFLEIVHWMAQEEAYILT